MRIFKLTGLAFMVSALVAPFSGALAQSQDESAEPVEEIITTGSRIARKDLTGSAAVQILDEEAIRVTGNVSIGDVLQDLTINANAINVQFNNGGDGSTKVNLRGIGQTRTLTLLNGRRMVGTAGTSSVDLNAIPLAIIERVEVLKDGASAVYGSDAVAGVVNIITRTDFEGIEMNAFVGQSGEGDGQITDFNITLGLTNDKGNMILSGGFYEQQDIFSGERDFGFFDQTFDWVTGTPGTTGSTGTPEGTIIDWTGDAGNQLWDDVINGSCTSGFCWQDPSLGWVDFSTAGTSDVGAGSLYNYQPINYLLTPQQRYNIYASGRYELSDMVSVFAEAHYLNRQSDQLLAPTPLFIISEGITVTADNFYNPFDRGFEDIRRRFLEAGGRNFLQNVDTFRAVLGLQGDLPGEKGWTWEFYGNYGQTDQQSTGLGRFIRSRVISAIGPSFMDTNGDIVCGTPGNVLAGCVPLDLFGGAANRPMTQEMIDYISYEGTGNQFQTQRSFALNMSGDLFEMPAGTLGMAFGLEYREERGGDIPDPITNSGDTTGNKREITRGSFDVTEAYIEFLVPIFTGFEASLALRHSDYSAFGTTTNGKVGLIWDITDSFTVRGTVSEAFRAPTIDDLFSGNSDSFPASSDPCDTGTHTRTANQEINCTADGLPSDYVDARTQLRAQLGGNPNTQPETADTFTLGFVWQPGFLEGFSLTMDWWDIEIQDSIQSIGTNVILSTCYDAPAGSRANCDRIIRNSAGFLTDVVNTTGNIGGANIAGLDTTFAFDHSTSIGDFRYNLDISYLDEYTETQADGNVLVGLGYYDLGVFVDWKASFNANWRNDAWMVNYNLRYIDDFIECEDDNCQGFESSEPDPLFRTVDTYFQHDVQIGYDLDLNSGQGSFTLGIQNLFDEEPPRVYNGFTAASDTSTYDYIGRYFYLSYRHTM